MSRTTIQAIALLLVVISFLCIEPAYAYIDPGTGSMILQALVAGALVALAFGKRIYYSITGLFRKSGPGDEDDDDASDLARRDDA